MAGGWQPQAQTAQPACGTRLRASHCSRYEATWRELARWSSPRTVRGLRPVARIALRRYGTRSAETSCSRFKGIETKLIRLPFLQMASVLSVAAMIEQRK